MFPSTNKKIELVTLEPYIYTCIARAVLYHRTHPQKEKEKIFRTINIRVDARGYFTRIHEDKKEEKNDKMI